ncbi:hypothetical protein I316_04280 [Kwoniella heveanensis BCC8398]|uniref:Tethering factor for nuclear proteasome STS1 n=1 Tax=Kwoniella heveanensis BCC8398 TaxID=1296120 RepID=A0A1B9GSV6_9TREE|nr:hypothetical protein I316_04280 [Kwoniella heveanensis BCC8398]
MAHPLTQQPPSSLPFAFAAKPSPLSFGFGLPSTPVPFSSPSQSFPSPSASGSGFRASGSNNASNWPISSPSPTKLTALRSRPALTPTPSHGQGLAATPSGGAPISSLKRSRRSRSPSSSPPLSPNSFASSSSLSRPVDPSAAAAGQATKVDLSAVAGLALGDGNSSGSGLLGMNDTQKTAKRSRLVRSVAESAATSTSTSASENLDVGILLASLPASAHLPILLKLLQAHPGLSDEVLPQIPRPDLRACVKELQLIFDRVQKVAGPSVGVSFGAAGASENQIAESRRWERSKEEVDMFCRTASTYIRYFTSPPTKPSNSSQSVDFQSLFVFFHPLTNQLYHLLRLVPSSSTSNGVLDLAKLILSSWTTWVDTLSREVNGSGGMYPHSLVTQWADSLDQLTSGTTSGAFSSSATPTQTPTFGWLTPQQSPAAHHWSSSSFSGSVAAAGSTSSPSAFEQSFQQALKPVRDRFNTEVGWLIGRR